MFFCVPDSFLSYKLKVNSYFFDFLKSYSVIVLTSLIQDLVLTFEIYQADWKFLRSQAQVWFIIKFTVRQEPKAQTGPLADLKRISDLCHKGKCRWQHPVSDISNSHSLIVQKCMPLIHRELAVKFIQLLLLENLQIIINSQVLPNTISFQELYYFLLQTFLMTEQKGIQLWKSDCKRIIILVEKENCMM